MTNLKRYGFVQDSLALNSWWSEIATGEWVKFEDHEEWLNTVQHNASDAILALEHAIEVLHESELGGVADSLEIVKSVLKRHTS